MLDTKSLLLGVVVGIVLTTGAFYMRDLNTRIEHIESFLSHVTGGA